MASFTLDRSNPFHDRVAERLASEQVGWLVTVGTDGTPQPSPVWFLWDGADHILIYSQEAPKVRNIEAQPRVAFHFNSDEHGGNVVIFTGPAVVDRSHPVALDHQPFIEKYAEGIRSIPMTNESFSADYHVPVIMTIEKLRGH